MNEYRDEDGSLWVRKSNGLYSIRYSSGKWSDIWNDYTLEEVQERFGGNSNE